MTKKNNNETNAPQKKAANKNNTAPVVEESHHVANHLSSGAKHSMKSHITSLTTCLVGLNTQ